MFANCGGAKGLPRGQFWKIVGARSEQDLKMAMGFLRMSGEQGKKAAQYLTKSVLDKADAIDAAVFYKLVGRGARLHGKSTSNIAEQMMQATNPGRAGHVLQFFKHAELLNATAVGAVLANQRACQLAQSPIIDKWNHGRTHIGMDDHVAGVVTAASACTVQALSTTVAEVTANPLGQKTTVDLAGRTCTCLEFQANDFPDVAFIEGQIVQLSAFSASTKIT